MPDKLLRVEVLKAQGVRQMMKQVVESLKGQEYVSAGNVEALRTYIRAKNPGCSEKELFIIFADALHKIIDTKICQFEAEYREKIKKSVLKRAVKKKEFSINAAEVFSSCLALKLHDKGYMEAFALWVSQNQPAAVSAEELDRLVSKAAQFDEELIEADLMRIIDEFEADREEKELPAEAPAVSCKAGISMEIPDASGEISSCIEAEAKPGIPVFQMLFIRQILPAALLLIVISAFALNSLAGGNRIHALQRRDQGKYADLEKEQVDRYLSLEARVIKKLGDSAGENGLIFMDGLHDALRYEEVDGKKLKKWLAAKNSMLAEEPYFTAIIAVSKKYDIHPLLMFAITGQEQSFVPKNSAAAVKIANNPFNVYGSWERYNTDIYDSSRLAADTIIKSSRNRPAYIDTIKWINRRYAEDPNWWNGVSMIFAQMRKDLME